jgi:exopolyphosphatase/guanosine-5'-triphosphate,3'-diphosphate pyrophosphatase
MACACIDIGSNTTRLLVAERDPAGGLRELATERVFTAIGATAGPDGALAEAKIAEVVNVVAAQVAAARGHGAEPIATVATAAVRRAPNRAALVGALAGVGVELQILSAEREARLAFAGAVSSSGLGGWGSAVAVVDVGGGSTEVVVGRPGEEPAWWTSLPVGSSTLTVSCIRFDPPSRDCLAALEAAATAAFAAVAPPPIGLALAVGGSATSLVFLAAAADPALDDRALRAALAALAADSVAATALRLGLQPERVRVLPAGITLLAAASRVFAAPLRIARGGLREGVVLELLART